MRLGLIYEAPSPLAVPRHQTLDLTPVYIPGCSEKWHCSGSPPRDASTLRLLARFPLRPWTELAFDRRVTAREAKSHVSFRLRQHSDPVSPLRAGRLDTDVIHLILDELFKGNPDTVTPSSLAAALPEWAEVVQSQRSRHVQHLHPWAAGQPTALTFGGGRSSDEGERVLAALKGCKSLEQAACVWSTPRLTRRLLDELGRNRNMKHVHLCKAPPNGSPEGITSFLFSFADLARLFAAWVHLETLEIDAAFEPAEPGQVLVAHQAATLQTFSLNDGSAVVSEIRHLLGISLSCLTTLCLEDVSGLNGQELCSLVMELSALQHLR